MDFPIIRRAKQPEINHYHTNGWYQHLTNGRFDDRIPHSKEKDLGGGANWVVQKYGGTSVGKSPLKIAEDIVLPWLKDKRIALVCSARSTSSKLEGTTNRLLRAAEDTQKVGPKQYADIIETIKLDHIEAGQAILQDNQDILQQYIKIVEEECLDLLNVLKSAEHLKQVSPLTRDMVMSVGEKLSCQYMTALLRSRGVNAVYVDMSAVVSPDVSKRLGVGEMFYHDVAIAMGEHVLKECGSDCVPVITGYFGVIDGGLLEQMGRGYTDLCAALVAIGLNARELQIWKEVDGIYTADPRKVPTARLIEAVTPSEAAELTFYGSEVIHPFTMDQVIRAHIPIRVKNVLNPRSSGTEIKPDTDDNQYRRPGYLFRDRSNSNLAKQAQQPPKRPTAVTIKKGIFVLNVHSKKRTRAHGFLMSIFSTLDKHKLSVDLISSSEVHVSLALHSEKDLFTGGGAEETKIFDTDLRACVDDLCVWGDVDLVPKMAIISLVGRQLRSLVGVSGRFFSTLGMHGINIEMISQGASEINISCVIEEREADRALSVVHTNLFTHLD